MSETNAALGPMARYLVQALGIADVCAEYRAFRDRRHELDMAECVEDVEDVLHEYRDLTDRIDDLAIEIAWTLIEAADSPHDSQRRLIDADQIRRLRGDGGLNNG